MKQYLHVHCQKYALLVETSMIEEVINIGNDDPNGIHWRNQSLTYIDLSACLIGHELENRDCLIVRELDSETVYAVGVGQVHNIEALDESQFGVIPQLDFHYNHFFDKAYIHPQTKQCIYRLKSDAFKQALKQSANHDN